MCLFIKRDHIFDLTKFVLDIIAPPRKKHIYTGAFFVVDETLQYLVAMRVRAKTGRDIQNGMASSSPDNLNASLSVSTFLSIVPIGAPFFIMVDENEKKSPSITISSLYPSTMNFLTLKRGCLTTATFVFSS